LRLSAQFHEKLLFIKKHLESKAHPISKIINHFKDLYSCQYYFLLMKNKKVFLKTYNKAEGKDEQDLQMIYDSPSMAKEKRIKNNVKVLEKEIKGFINCIVS